MAEAARETLKRLRTVPGSPQREQPARVWRSGTFTTDAKFLSLKDGTVRLKKQDGSIIWVPLGKLTDADQEYVKMQTDTGNKP